MRVGEVVPLELAVHEAVLLFSRAPIEERVMEWRREERARGIEDVAHSSQKQAF